MELGDFFDRIYSDGIDEYRPVGRDKKPSSTVRLYLNCLHAGHYIDVFRKNDGPYGTVADVSLEADRAWKSLMHKHDTTCVFCVTGTKHTYSLHYFMKLSWPLGQVKLTRPLQGIVCVFANFQKCANFQRDDASVIRASVRDDTTLMFDGRADDEQCPLCREERYHTILSHMILNGIKPAQITR